MNKCLITESVLKDSKKNLIVEYLFDAFNHEEEFIKLNDNKFV